MARPTFGKHWKFRRLCHILGEPLPHVRGYMELLWEVAYETGEAVIGDEVDVELAAHYPGEPGRFAAAVEKVRLIDRLEDGRLAVHDLWDHAPDYVRKRWARERDRKLSYAPRDRPLTAEWRKELELGGHCPPKCDTRQTKGDLGKTPSPTPSPSSSSPKKKFRGKNSPETPSCPETDEDAVSRADEPAAEVLMTFPCDGKQRQWALTASQASSWQLAYPALDVVAECRKALAWVEASPERKKTAKGMTRFLVGWLGRAQDSPRRAGAAHVNGSGTPDYWAQTNAIIAEAEAKHAGRRK